MIRGEQENDYSVGMWEVHNRIALHNRRMDTNIYNGCILDFDYNVVQKKGIFLFTFRKLTNSLRGVFTYFLGVHSFGSLSRAGTDFVH